MLLRDKKGISIMIGYVLLVVSAIVLSVVVYQWIKTYVPADKLDCPSDVSMFIEDVNYTCHTLEISLKNNGLFNIDGYFIHITDEEEQELATIDLSDYHREGEGGAVLFGPKNSLESNKKRLEVFDLNTFDRDQIYSIEITPIRFQKENGKSRLVSCGGAKIREDNIITCSGNGECMSLGNGCGCYGSWGGSNCGIPV
jgi:hypothetical protein